MRVRVKQTAKTSMDRTHTRTCSGRRRMGIKNCRRTTCVLIGHRAGGMQASSHHLIHAHAHAHTRAPLPFVLSSLLGIIVFVLPLPRP